MKHCKKDQNEKCLTLVNFKSNHGGDFDKYVFKHVLFLMKNTLIGKMDAKSDKTIFMGYALQSI